MLDRPLPPEVSIRDQTPREGFSREDRILTTEEKLEVIAMLAAAGLRRITAVCFVHPRWVPQWADADEVARALPDADRICYSALIPNMKGLERAIEAGTIREICLIFAATDSIVRAEINRSQEETYRHLEEVIAVARTHGIESVAGIGGVFGCPYEGPTPRETVLRWARRFEDAGAATIMLGDSTGLAGPAASYELFAAARAALAPTTALTAHFHNARGQSLPASLAALAAGADCFDTCLAESGGSPFLPATGGNVCTEDLVYMLDDLGVRTGVDHARLAAASRRLEALYGHEFPGHSHRAGPPYPWRGRPVEIGLRT